MSYDAKKAAYQEVTILGRPALFAECRIDNSTVPKGLYRYELRHGDENWGDPVSLSRNIIVNYYGAVLTREPFQLPIEGWIPLEDDSLSFQDGGCRTLAEFQRKYPVSKKDVIDFFVANDDSLHDFYFSHSEAQDKATGCVGHLRGDFGSGKQFFTTWWPHQGDQLNTPAFKADIDRAVNWLREQPDSPLHDFDTMKRFCGRFERSCAIKGAMLPSYAFMAKTKQYVYMIRCTPVKGDYEDAVHHNCVFVGYRNDKPAYGALRGTLSDSTFAGEAPGSDKRFSFAVPRCAGGKTLCVFEAAIDALSYLTLLKLRGQDWRAANTLSLSGIYQPRKDGSIRFPAALEQYLKDNPCVERIVLCLDNDEPGRAASAAIQKELSEYGTVHPRPHHGRESAPAPA